MKKYLENMDPKIKIAFSNFNVLKNQIFSKLKDQSPLTNNSGVVYKISCMGCRGVYVGETKQLLKKRIYSHRYDIRHLEKDSTALAKHVKDSNHNVDLDNNISILVKEKNCNRRKIREVIEIMKEKHAINFKTDNTEMYTFYSHIFESRLFFVLKRVLEFLYFDMMYYFSCSRQFIA